MFQYNTTTSICLHVSGYVPGAELKFFCYKSTGMVRKHGLHNLKFLTVWLWLLWWFEEECFPQSWVFEHWFPSWQQCLGRFGGVALLGKWSLGVDFESVRPHPTSSLLSLLHACSLRSELPAFCHGFLLRWTLTPLEQQGQTSSLFYKLPWWFNMATEK